MWHANDTCSCGETIYCRTTGTCFLDWRWYIRHGEGEALLVWEDWAYVSAWHKTTGSLLDPFPPAILDWIADVHAHEARASA